MKHLRKFESRSVTNLTVGDIKDMFLFLEENYVEVSMEWGRFNNLREDDILLGKKKFLEDKILDFYNFRIIIDYSLEQAGKIGGKPGYDLSLFERKSQIHSEIVKICDRLESYGLKLYFNTGYAHANRIDSEDYNVVITKADRIRGIDLFTDDDRKKLKNIG